MKHEHHLRCLRKTSSAQSVTTHHFLGQLYRGPSMILIYSSTTPRAFLQAWMSSLGLRCWLRVLMDHASLLSKAGTLILITRYQMSIRGQMSIPRATLVHIDCVDDYYSAKRVILLSLSRMILYPSRFLAGFKASK